MPKRKLNATPPSPRAAPGSRDSNERSRPTSKQEEQQQPLARPLYGDMDGASPFGRPGASRSGSGGPSSSRPGPSNKHQFEEKGRPRKKVFDVFSWYPNYQSCQRYFLEVAQFEYACQALAAFLNIKLPYQRLSAADFKHYQLASNNVRTGMGLPPPYRMGGFPPQPPAQQHIPPIPGQQGIHLQSVDHLSFGNVSLLPYVRRLVVTGYDADGIMHGWFGDDWVAGLNPLLESERQNYMFASKSSDWLTLKKSYDTVIEESVPFMVPLQRVTEPEIVRAEDAWSAALSMRDWTIGPRSLEEEADQEDGVA